MILIFFCTISILIILFVFGDLLLHGVWDSFVDFPYGIFFF